MKWSGACELMHKGRWVWRRCWRDKASVRESLHIWGGGFYLYFLPPRGEILMQPVKTPWVPDFSLHDHLEATDWEQVEGVYRVVLLANAFFVAVGSYREAVYTALEIVRSDKGFKSYAERHDDILVLCEQLNGGRRFGVLLDMREPGQQMPLRWLTFDTKLPT